MPSVTKKVCLRWYNERRDSSPQSGHRSTNYLYDGKKCEILTVLIPLSVVNSIRISLSREMLLRIRSDFVCNTQTKLLLINARYQRFSATICLLFFQRGLPRPLSIRHNRRIGRCVERKHFCLHRQKLSPFTFYQRDIILRSASLSRRGLNRIKSLCFFDFQSALNPHFNIGDKGNLSKRFATQTLAHRSLNIPRNSCFLCFRVDRHTPMFILAEFSHKGH